MTKHTDMNISDIDLASFDIILVNSSAGKDSQAMLNHVCFHARKQGVLDRVVCVHADLGRAEWAGTRELAAEQAAHYGVRFIVTEAYDKDGNRRDLLQHVLEHGKWMGYATRFCTSEHKRGPIMRVMTQLTNELHGNVRTSKANPSKLGRQVRILNCMGHRREEGKARKKMPQMEANKKATNGRREVIDYRPIHDWNEQRVWSVIRLSKVRHHPAYDLGMPRLSCVFCFYAPKDALLIAAKHNPELLREYVEVEQAINHTFTPDLALADIQAAVEAGEADDIGPCTCWADCA